MTSSANGVSHRDVFGAVYGDWESPSRASLANVDEARVTRLAAETLDELSRVMQRVGNICQSFELGQSLLDYKTSCGAVEYIKDMAELEDMLKDELKRKRYQDHVTVFIVGFENTCHERIRLLQQVNEVDEHYVDDVKVKYFFFSINSAAPTFDQPLSVDEDNTDDIDIDGMTSAVARTLETTQQLVRRLDRLHREAINSVKRSNQPKAANREKKKLEKSLHKAEADVSNLSGIILQLQREISDRDDGARRHLSLAGSRSSIATKSTKEMFDLSSSSHAVTQEQPSVVDSQQTAGSTNPGIDKSINDFTLTMECDQRADASKIDIEVQQPLSPSRVHTQVDGLAGIRETGNMGLSKTSRDHKGSTTVSPGNKSRATVSGQGVVKAAPVVETKKNITSRTVARQQSTATLSSGLHASVTSSAGGWTTINVQSSVVIPTAIQESPTSEAPRSSMSSAPLFTTAASGDLSTNAHGYTVTSPDRRSTSKIEAPNSDDIIDKFDDSTEVNDGESWVKQKISELEDQLLALERKSQKKTDSFKTQFLDHKKRWMSERDLLLGCIEQAQKLQLEADNTLVQMERIICDYEQVDSTTSVAMHQSIDMVVNTEENGHGTCTKEMGDDDYREPGDGEVSIEKSSSDDLHSSFIGLASLRRKHRSMFELLKSRAEQTRASSVGFQLLASRASSFLTAELDDSLDGDVETSSSSNIHGDNVKHLTSTSNETYEGTRIARVEPEVSEHDIVQMFMNIYESAVDMKRVLQRQAHIKDNRPQEENSEDVEYRENISLKIQLEHLSSITRTILEDCKRDVATSPQRIVKADYENDDNDADTDTGKERLQLASSMGVPPSRITSVDGDAYGRSSSTDSAHLSTMIGRYQALEKAYEIETTRYHDLLNHKTAVIDEMQKTIDKLKYELGSLQHNTTDLLHYDEHLLPQSVSPIMFTRLDTDRNSTTMKKALIERKIDPQKYQTAVKVMNDYNSLPLQRWVHLTKKYVSHRNMSRVLDKVEHNGRPDAEVNSTLSKMVSLHNARMIKYSHLMSNLSSSRIELADQLMETLMAIEQESGIFLIKPMFSWRGRRSPEADYYKTKRTRPNQPVPRRQTVAGTSTVTNANSMRAQRDELKRVDDDGLVQRQTREDAEIILGLSKQPLLGQQPQPMWTQSQSTAAAASNSLQSGTTSDEIRNRAAHVPRMLELDINRILINQNHVSGKAATSQSITSLVHPVTSASSTRSYVSLNRVGKQQILQRSLSATGILRNSLSTPVAPPSNENQVTEVMTPTGELVRSLNSVDTGSSHPGTSRSGRNPAATSPLPPIIVPAAISPESH